MSFGGVKVTLLVGKVIPAPAPAALLVALRSAEVTVSDTGSSGFQLQFELTRSVGASDYDLLGHLEPFARVVIVVTVDGTEKTIVDGLITNRQLSPGRAGQPTIVTVTGEDISVAMDLIEHSTPYPGMNDWAIVSFILLEYAMYGIVPTVLPTEISISNLPLETTNQQTGTHRQYLRKLAQRNGYVFHVRPGPVPLTNIGYFGPPIRIGVPYPALTVTPLAVSGLESIHFTYDALAAELVYGSVQDTLETDADIPVLTLRSLRMPPLAAKAGLFASLPYFRSTLLCGTGMDPMQAYAKAQATTDLSSDRVLVAEGELDVFRYQHLLSVPGIVGVRGAGEDHDGLYYVTSVTHKLTPSSYKQSFSLAREGLGSLVAAVPS